MALSISKPTQYGPSVTANYWRVSQAVIDTMARTAVVSVAGYVDQSARDSGAQPLATVDGIAIPDLDLSGNPLAQAYDALKARPEFAGATDA